MSILHDITTKLGSRLRAKACPVEVIDGPEENPPTAWRDQRVVVEYDRESTDSWEGAGLSTNPKQRLMEFVAVKITLYARSPRSDAPRTEHEHRAMLLRHMVLVALERVVRLEEFEWRPPTSGRFTTPKALEGSEREGGAVYEMKWQLPLAVPDLTWTGGRIAEAELQGAGENKTLVHDGTGDDNDPSTVPADAVTACGED